MAKIDDLLKKGRIFSQKAAADLSIKAKDLGGKLKIQGEIAAQRLADFQDDRKRRKEERERAEKITKFNKNVETLENCRAVLPPSTLRNLEAWKSANLDPEQKASFSNHPDVVALLGAACKRMNFYTIDKERAASNHVFTATSGDLLWLVPEKDRTQIIKSLVRQHSVRGTGTTAATVVSVLNKNYGGTAAMMANNAKIGAHNGQISALYNNLIFSIDYKQSATAVSPEQGRLIRLAYRFRFFQYGDEAQVRRCLFALIYNGGSVRWSLDSRNKFAANAQAEFHNAFRGYMMTPLEAKRIIDSLVEQARNDLPHALDADVSQAMQLYYKAPLPEPPSAIKERRQSEDHEASSPTNSSEELAGESAPTSVETEPKGPGAEPAQGATGKDK
ncbi:hypothetical protein EOW65_19480 [Sinirhodobacter ferrireducens]|uniref:Uncharacterized protein n=1 Tax=Paenirhodobacter ferrireducens TaxID=1215032 RepID=A0A443L499_9RHOB|nr:hypothetical protein EOW65_19480 [Sinirhodobacter ferrireducens]